MSENGGPLEVHFVGGTEVGVLDGKSNAIIVGVKRSYKVHDGLNSGSGAEGVDSLNGIPSNVNGKLFGSGGSKE